MRTLLFSALVASALCGSTFFNLEGIEGYDIVVADTGGKVDRDTLDEMKEAMQESAKRLGVDTSPGHTTVLAAVLTLFSLEREIGVRIELELGEYFKRQRTGKEVFAVSYADSATLRLEDVDEEGVDALEELLDTFERQYRADNTPVATSQTRSAKEVTHENFADVMGYAASYLDARNRAIKENKRLLVYMSAAYCPWCRKLEQRILTNPDVNEAIRRRFVPVRLEYAKKRFPARFLDIPITPTLYIVDPKTEKIERRFVGYHEHDAFLQLLNEEVGKK